MNYLLDTNIIIEIMKKNPQTRVFQWVSELDRIIISAVTLEELVYGLRRRSLLNKEAWLRQMLADKGRIISITDSAAHWCGEKRALLEADGRIVTQADSLIAACAWEQSLVLATRNTGDFMYFGIPLINPFDA